MGRLPVTAEASHLQSLIRRSGPGRRPGGGHDGLPARAPLLCSNPSLQAVRVTPKHRERERQPGVSPQSEMIRLPRGRRVLGSVPRGRGGTKAALAGPTSLWPASRNQTDCGSISVSVRAAGSSFLRCFHPSAIASASFTRCPCLAGRWAAPGSSGHPRPASARTGGGRTAVAEPGEPVGCGGWMAHERTGPSVSSPGFSCWATRLRPPRGLATLL